MAPRKKKPFDRDAWLRRYIRTALAKIWRWYPPRKRIKDAAMVSSTHAKCMKCDGVFLRSETQVDHINPVVPVTGFVSWDDEINRRFCDEAVLQNLCVMCHNAKSKSENAERRKRKKKK